MSRTTEGTKMNRIGPRMTAAAAYVAAHPGCPKLPVAIAVGPNQSTNFGYRAVDRAIAAGLIEHRGGMAGRYSLYVTDKGAAAIS
jgi:hypothetical protein